MTELLAERPVAPTATRTMRAAARPQLRRAARGGGGSRAAARPGPGARSHRGDPGLCRHRHPRRARRLAGQARPAVHPRPRGCRDRRDDRQRRDRGRARRPRRHPVARSCVRGVRLLRQGLGDAVREPAEHRLHRSTGHAEYAVASARYVVRVPDGIDPFDAAPLTCAADRWYKAIEDVRRTAGRPRSRVRHGGARPPRAAYAGSQASTVVAVDVVDEKLELGEAARRSSRRERAARGSG